MVIRHNPNKVHMRLDRLSPLPRQERPNTRPTDGFTERVRHPDDQTDPTVVIASDLREAEDEYVYQE